MKSLSPAYKYPLWIFAFCLFCFSCAIFSPSAGTKNVLLAPELEPFGRYAMNDRQELELISSAMHFGFSFEGSTCSIQATIPDKKGHNYLQYELDGVYQKRIRVNGNTTDSIVLTASIGGRHTIWLYKATEAHTGPIFIKKVTAKNIRPLKRPDAPLIEFIGNSITCGAAADASEFPCGTGEYHDQHNAYMAYGPRVARLLGANFMVSSVSGIGMYRNWNSDGPTMPQVYEKVDFQDKSTRLWDFSKYSPKVVSIALGTNDFSNGDGRRPRLPFDSATFVNTAVKFIQLVKSKYPGAKIALLSSPMQNGKPMLTLQHCLTAAKVSVDAASSKSFVSVFFFKPMRARGCGGHPSVEDHAILAEQLEPFFKKLLTE